MIKTKNKCSHCDEFAVLEDWGKSKLCPECVISYKNSFPERANKEKSPDVNIVNPSIHGGDASYNPITGDIELIQAPYKEDRVIVWFSHEFIHYLLHRTFSLKCCYQYDNISPHGELDDIQSLS